MTRRDRYITERFLAAYDEAMLAFNYSDEQMEMVLVPSNGRHVAHAESAVRKFMALHMREGKNYHERMRYREIAECLGVNAMTVANYLRRTGKLDEVAEKIRMEA